MAIIESEMISHSQGAAPEKDKMSNLNTDNHNNGKSPIR